MGLVLAAVVFVLLLYLVGMVVHALTSVLVLGVLVLVLVGLFRVAVAGSGRGRR